MEKIDQYNLKEFKARIIEDARILKNTRQEFKALQRSGESCWNEQYNLDALKGDYRSLHIAYSLLKGNSYEEIERTVKEGNEPNWKDINSYLDTFNLQQAS